MKALKFVGVILTAVILTTFAIDASDTLSGRGGTLLAQLSGAEKSVCPIGMIHLPAALTFSCVDQFEASAGKKCLVQDPEKPTDTEINLLKSDCEINNDGVLAPWRYIAREQAAVMCTRSGKRLPSAAEWYQFTLGTDKSKCNIKGSEAVKSNTYNECLSAAGVRNGVGNVWEWVADDVINGVYQGRDLPETGYVSQVDSGGVATVTIPEEIETSNSEGYFWSNATGTYAIIRGGFYGSRSDAGVYTTHAYTLPTFTGAGVGFRCVR